MIIYPNGKIIFFKKKKLKFSIEKSLNQTLNDTKLENEEILKKEKLEEKLEESEIKKEKPEKLETEKEILEESSELEKEIKNVSIKKPMKRVHRINLKIDILHKLGLTEKEFSESKEM